MGQHIVPQRLLRQFADPRDRAVIYMYDRTSGWGATRLPIKAVAQKPDFHSRSMESKLAEIEAAAQPGLDKLRSGAAVSGRDREAIAAYVAAFFERTERGQDEKRRIQYEEMPKLLGHIAEEFGARDARRMAVAWEEWQGSGRSEAIVNHLARSHIELPDVTAHVRSCAWWVVHTAVPEFAIADHPVYYNASVGLRSSAATLPIADNAALLMQPWPGDDVVHLRADEEPVDVRRLSKWINRLSVYQARRFLFFSSDTDAIRRIAGNPQWARPPHSR